MEKGFIIPLLFHFLEFWFVVFKLHPKASSEHHIGHMRCLGKTKILFYDTHFTMEGCQKVTFLKDKQRELV